MKKETTEYILDFRFGDEKITELMIVYLKEKTIEELTQKEHASN